MHMPDGTLKTAGIRTIQTDQFDDASLSLSKALALSDVLAMMANHSEAVEMLDEHSLATTSSMLWELLRETQEILHTAMGVGVPVAAAEVA
jgi:hypothetical protein